MALSTDDWLVADSEDEDAFTQLLPVIGPGASAATRSPVASNLTSSDAIQTAVFSSDRPCTPRPQRQSPSRSANESLFSPPSPASGVDPAIGNFTNATSAPNAPLVIPSRPRPRPRVVIKKVANSEHNASTSNTSFSHISVPSISAARRIDDSIHSATSTSFGLSEVADDLYSSFDIAERAKLRSRRSQAAKKPTIPSYEMNEVIELTSDEDELVLKPAKRQKKQANPVPKPQIQTKPRPKPRLKVGPPAVLPNDSPPSQTTVPQPQEPPVQRSSSSQLPAFTLPTVPPTSSLQDREPTPASSPPVATRKRKMFRPSIAEDDDEMDLIGGNSTRMPPPSTEPLPFFASSSSSVPTDSGIEIPPIEPLSGCSNKKKNSSGRKGTQTRTRNKGKKGKNLEVTCAVDKVVEEPARVTTQEPSNLATPHGPSVAEECHSPTAKKKASATKSATKKGKAKVIYSSEEEDETSPPPRDHTPGEGEGERSKENLRPNDTSSPKRHPPRERAETFGVQARGSTVKHKPSPMSELIRRVNSQPNSPFLNASKTYSPYLKSSRTMLSRIAPLHPNRRTPPPPMPRPPPPKKSKKQLQMEERIEEELAETVEGWSCLTDEERKALRMARIDAELGCE